MHRSNLTIRLLSFLSAFYAASSPKTSAFSPHLLLTYQIQRPIQPTISDTSSFLCIQRLSRTFSSTVTTITTTTYSSSSTRLYIGGPPPPFSSSKDDDEYDVIVLYPKSEIPFFLQETPDGEAAFAGYVQYDQPCSTIKNVGDVLVAIDGESVQGKPIRQIVQMVQEKARNCAYSFLRFRSTGSKNINIDDLISSSSGADGKSSLESALASGQLPGERRRGILERKMQQLEQQVSQQLSEIESLQATRTQKLAELDALDKKDLEWIEEQRQYLLSPNRNFSVPAETISEQLPSPSAANFAFTSNVSTKGGSSAGSGAPQTPSAKDSSRPQWNMGGGP